MNFKALFTQKNRMLLSSMKHGLKKSILDGEILPKETYKLDRTDMSGQSHPWNHKK